MAHRLTDTRERPLATIGGLLLLFALTLFFLLRG